MPDKKNWNGNHATAEDALNTLRQQVAQSLGMDEQTWPEHGDAALAIAGAFETRYSQAGAWKNTPETLKEVNQELSNGYSVEFDYFTHKNGELIEAAMGYIEAGKSGLTNKPANFPSSILWKTNDKRRSLLKAAVLLLSEVRRMDYADTSPKE